MEAPLTIFFFNNPILENLMLLVAVTQRQKEGGLCNVGNTFGGAGSHTAGTGAAVVGEVSG
jgi:hypothetical protein